MQLEVRSLNVTWRRDLRGHRVIVFFLFGNVPNCWLNRYGKFGGAMRRRFFSLSAKNLRGGANNRPPAVRGLTMVSASVVGVNVVFSKRPVSVESSFEGVEAGSGGKKSWERRQPTAVALSTR